MDKKFKNLLIIAIFLLIVVIIASVLSKKSIFPTKAINVISADKQEITKEEPLDKQESTSPDIQTEPPVSGPLLY